MRVLLVGSGGREHALAWRLASSDSCKALYCAPGNPGIAQIADCVPIDAGDIDGLCSLCQRERIDFVVVGPEKPLVLGLCDRLRALGIAVFGPSQAAAQLEGSKAFTKDFIAKNAAPLVVKADGLAAGKGVFICPTKDAAEEAATALLSGARLGDAGAHIVIEEFLEGEELSFFALSDGETVMPFNSAQDHKRVGEGDTGPNTGGMGAYSPAHILTLEMQHKIMERIINPTIAGMKARGTPFCGVLFAGIMVVKDDPYLIEYNVRFGDPECQAMMLRCQNDILDLLYACAVQNLKSFTGHMLWSSHVGLCVVMAAKGYPESPQTGSVIRGLEAPALNAGTMLFHAGTARGKDGDLIAAGGRVLNICCAAPSVKEAQQNALNALGRIDWPDGFYRRDIGWRAIKASQS